MSREPTREEQLAAQAARRRRYRRGDVEPVEPDEREQRAEAERIRAEKIARGLIRVAQARPAWYDQAACKGKTGLMYATAEHVGRGNGERDAPRVRAALALCAGCPVRVPCRDAGRAGAEFGVWGGETAVDRAGLGIVPSPAPAAMYRAARDARDAREANG